MGQRAICFGLVLVLSFCGLATAGPQVDTTGPDGPRYLIGIADKLHVSIWDEPTLQWHVTVRPDGKISLPLLNDVLVVGFTPEAVRLRITEDKHLRLYDFHTCSLRLVESLEQPPSGDLTAPLSLPLHRGKEGRNPDPPRENGRPWCG